MTIDWLYITKDDCQRIHDGCDLGDSVQVRAYQYPYANTDMNKFIAQSEVEKLQEDNEALKRNLKESNDTRFEAIERTGKLQAETEQLKQQLAEINKNCISIDLHESRMKKVESNYDTAIKVQDILREKLGAALEGLRFECGNRCAHQNPCNAKETLMNLGVE